MAVRARGRDLRGPRPRIVGPHRAPGRGDRGLRGAGRHIRPRRDALAGAVADVDLHAARALVFLERSHPDAYRAFALTLMRMAFLEGFDNSELDSVLEAGRRTGIDQDELRRALGDQGVKDRLRAINR